MNALLRNAYKWPKCTPPVSAAAFSTAPSPWRKAANSSSKSRERERNIINLHHEINDSLDQLKDSLDHGESSSRGGRPSKNKSTFSQKRSYQMFEVLVNARVNKVMREMGDYRDRQEDWRAFGVNNQVQLDSSIGLFKKALDTCFAKATEKGMISRSDNPLFWNLRNSFVKGDNRGLSSELVHSFQTFLMKERFPDAINELHREIADLRFPYEWYPATRMLQRTVHLHVGPTNSGKTYNALKALEGAKTGIYAGPLRLLAHEIWSRFAAKGKPCALVTGEEVRIPEGVDRWFHSCTVEMSPLNKPVDVAVVDEIQMIASEDRGWAWTQAVLGLQAKELHLCGEDRVVELIQDLCARIGDRCIVHRYQRLNPLETMSKSLRGDFRNLEKGDAVVAFSRVALHKLKAGIEQATGKRCAIVYGSLPPETRAQQAALFNDPNNEYDYLVASDAIGMGLNLEIKRVIFESSSKFDGNKVRSLTVPEIKQIGGRAGRYRTASAEIASAQEGAAGGEEAVEAKVESNTGWVTAFDFRDLQDIQNAFQKEAKPIETAGLFPPANIIERFHTYFPPRTPTSFVLTRLRELARLSPRFHLCDFDTALEIADAIQPYNLSVADRCVFLNCPVSFRVSRDRESNGQREALQAFAKCVAEMGSGHLLDFDCIDLSILDMDEETRMTMFNNPAYLQSLERLHQIITMYLWLSYRYEGVFQSQSMAFKVKEIVEDRITEFLDKLTYVTYSQARRRQAMREAAERHKKAEEQLLGEEEQEHLQEHHEEEPEEPIIEIVEELDPEEIIGEAIEEAGTGEREPGPDAEKNQGSG
ncbi:RNA helicase [Podospora pseudopauciseta]|uniref:RNA helicase n=1 Tax=Podospora pseudopauciseta TaxID=2093780 RepID=A0ABR0H4A2_9PEZI|nr:RNA helicase [Podospora pseudopauciseta]